MGKCQGQRKQLVSGGEYKGTTIELTTAGPNDDVAVVGAMSS